MKRRFTAAHQGERCKAVRTLRDGSTVDCMRRSKRDGLCEQHFKMTMKSQPKIEAMHELETALITLIKSGSSNGREDLRDKCLKMIPLIVKAVNEFEALNAVIDLIKQADVPALLRDTSKIHNEQLKGADSESQFYGEDVVSVPLANKIEKALQNLAAVRKENK